MQIIHRLDAGERGGDRVAGGGFGDARAGERGGDRVEAERNRRDRADTERQPFADADFVDFDLRSGGDKGEVTPPGADFGEARADPGATARPGS